MATSLIYEVIKFPLGVNFVTAAQHRVTCVTWVAPPSKAQGYIPEETCHFAIASPEP